VPPSSPRLLLSVSLPSLTGNDLFQQIRGDFLEMIDRSLRHLSKHWTDR
jgi:hypothetical protein